MGNRRRQRLVLTDIEITIIKGLVEHTDLNDQMILAIFSYASRSINSREIGYFRDSKNLKYKGKSTATKAEIETFLARYGRFERVAKQFGMLPQEAHFQQVQKATEAMKSAVAIFNNPNIRWKSEIFIVNAVISWTYLLHAYYTTKSIDYCYRKNGEALLTNDGRPKYWELTKCLKANECPLPKPVKSNLKYLIAVRNEIEHRLSDNVDAQLSPKLQACALNYNYWMCEWFGQEYSISEELAFAIQFSKISLGGRGSSAGVAKNSPAVIQAANKLIEAEMSSEEYNDPQYSYRVFVIPKTVNNPKKADEAVTFAEAGSNLEMAVREVERPKFKASEIVEKMRTEGFTNFDLYGKIGFVQFWKGMGAKNPNLGLGVEISGQWFWYDKMVGEVRAELTKRCAEANEQA